MVRIPASLVSLSAIATAVPAKLTLYVYIDGSSNLAYTVVSAVIAVLKSKSSLYSLSPYQSQNISPLFTGSSGRLAFPPCSTLCGLTDVPPSVTNLTVYVFFLHTAFKVISSFTVSVPNKNSSPFGFIHFSKVYPSFVGALGALGDSFPFTVMLPTALPPSLSNVIVYVFVHAASPIVSTIASTIARSNAKLFRFAFILSASYHYSLYITRFSSHLPVLFVLPYNVS